MNEENRVLMTCGHCLRKFWTLHCGSGDSLCCECVHTKRVWLALEKRGVEQHNKYAEELLAEHAGGKWCEGALLPIKRATTERRGLSGEAVLQFFDDCGSGWIRDEIEKADDDKTLNADEIG